MLLLPPSLLKLEQLRLIYLYLFVGNTFRCQIGVQVVEMRLIRQHIQHFVPF